MFSICFFLNFGRDLLSCLIITNSTMIVIADSARSFLPIIWIKSSMMLSLVLFSIIAKNKPSKCTRWVRTLLLIFILRNWDFFNWWCPNFTILVKSRSLFITNEVLFLFAHILTRGFWYKVSTKGYWRKCSFILLRLSISDSCLVCINLKIFFTFIIKIMFKGATLFNVSSGFWKICFILHYVCFIGHAWECSTRNRRLGRSK